MKSLTLLALIFALFPVAAATKPNIVVILADDMGYGDVGVLNPQSKIPTPHLDSLARSGATFLDAHSGSAVCTPTRYGLLTGRYCWRSRLKSGVLFPPRDKPLIEDDRPTIASYLKDHGYQTAMVGKWHLGIEWARNTQGKVIFDEPFTNGPIEKGFELWFGIAASLDMVPYVYLRDHQAVAKCTTTQKAIGFPKYVRAGPRDPNFDPGDVLDDLATEAATFIKKATSRKQDPAAHKPYFLYLPLTGPHKPVWPHKRFEGKTKLGPYGDFIYQVDYTIGVVLEAIADSGQEENTMVIYTSDNGSFMYRRKDGKNHHLTNDTDQGYRPADHSANLHWRGTKADVWEGGHRVPFFIRWKNGGIKAGTQVQRVTCHTDIFATIADAVGKPVPPGSAQDSFSFLPAARGKAETKPRPGVINHSASGIFAIRRGPWKLVAGNGSGGRQGPRGKPFQKPYHLYNLTEDPEEATNLIESKTSIAADLEAELTRIRNAK